MSEAPEMDSEQKFIAFVDKSAFAAGLAEGRRQALEDEGLIHALKNGIRAQGEHVSAAAVRAALAAARKEAGDGREQ